MNEGGGGGRSVEEGYVEASSPRPSYGMSPMLRERLIKSRRALELSGPKRRCIASGNRARETGACGTEELVPGASPSPVGQRGLQEEQEDFCAQSPNRGGSERASAWALSTPRPCDLNVSPGVSDLERTPVSNLNISTGSSPGSIGTPESEKALLESQDITVHQLSKELTEMKAALETKEELLRRLRMVYTYRKKNNLEELERLIFKWRSACQSLLCDLQREATSDNVHSLGQIIAGLGLDPALLQYDASEDAFI